MEPRILEILDVKVHYPCFANLDLGFRLYHETLRSSSRKVQDCTGLMQNLPQNDEHSAGQHITVPHLVVLVVLAVLGTLFRRRQTL